jgi:hypothetical protein
MLDGRADRIAHAKPVAQVAQGCLDAVLEAEIPEMVWRLGLHGVRQDQAKQGQEDGPTAIFKYLYPAHVAND